MTISRSPFTARADADADELPKDRLLDAAHLAGAVTLRAAHGLCPRFCAAALADGACLQARDLDLLVGPENGFPEGDLHAIAQVAPAGRAALRRALTGEPAEEFVENIGETTEATETARAAETAGAARPALRRRVTVTIIRRTLIRVAQHGVGFVDLFQPLFRIGRLIHVGVKLARQFPISRFQRQFVGGTRHAQHFIIITFTHSDITSLYPNKFKDAGSADALMPRRLPN